MGWSGYPVMNLTLIMQRINLIDVDVLVNIFYLIQYIYAGLG